MSKIKTVLALVAAFVCGGAWAVDGVISINMGKGFESVTADQVTLAGSVPVTDWIVCSENAGVYGSTTDSSSGVTVAWDITGRPGGSCVVDTTVANACKYFNGGLCRANRAGDQYSITISDIPYPKYKVYLYFTYDKRAGNRTTPYPAVTVNNGTSYRVNNGALAEGADRWGTAPEDSPGYTGPVLWDNAMLIEDLEGGTLALTGTCNQGAIAAVQIVKAVNPTQLYYNQLAGTETIPAKTYGEITIDSYTHGYKATSYSSNTGLSGTGVGSFSSVGSTKNGRKMIDTHTVAGWFKVGELPTGGAMKDIFVMRTGMVDYDGYKVAVDGNGVLKIGRINYSDGNYSWNDTKRISVTGASGAIASDTWFHLALAFTYNSNGSYWRLTPVAWINGVEATKTGDSYIDINLNGPGYVDDILMGAGISAAGFYIDSSALTSADVIKSIATNSDYVSAVGVAVSGNTSVSALKAMIPAGAPAYTFELEPSATLAVDASFDIPVSIACAGSLMLKAESAPAAATYTNLDLSAVQGAIKRSWLMPTSFGFNFCNSRGSDITKALEPSTWTVDESAQNNTTGVDLFADSLTKITWTSGGIYDDGQSEPQTFVRGYLDDNGANGTSIRVTNIPFERYDVIVYSTTDSASGSMSYKTVNGVNYTKDPNVPFAVVQGTSNWGSSRSSTAPAYGTNAIRISNQTSRDLTIASVRVGSGATGRGCISAIQVIDTSSTFTYTGVLTTSFVKTGWKVASADELLGYGYSGFMCGGYVDDKPRNASAHHVTKHDDGTVSFELQASNNQTKGVRVVMKVEDGEVQIKSTGAAYNGTGTNVGIKLFNDDGTVKETSGSHATAWNGDGYGVCQITASKGYRVSNASFVRNQGNYSGSATWTLTLSEKGLFENGDVVLVDRFMMGTEGTDTSKMPAKVKIGDVLSQTRSGPTTIGDLLYLIYTFATPVPVTIGEGKTLTFYSENGTRHTGDIRTRVVDYRTDLDNSCVLKISGQSQYCPLCIVSGNQAPAYNATISTATATWDSLAWEGDAVWENGDDKVATLTVDAESTLTIGSQITASILKIKGSANLTIADPQNLNAAKIDLQDYEGELILDTASNATIGGIVGGTIVKTGAAELGLNNKGTADAVSGTIVKINAGTVNLNSVDRGSRSTNATFVMNGGNLTNYGWPAFNGTLTLEYSGDSEKSIFAQKRLQGGPAVVKRGTGTLVVPAGSDGAFASITVEEGILRFSGNDVTATKLIPGAGTLDIPSGKTLTVGSVQAGAGTIKVAGTGELRINNASAFTGTFDIAESAEVVLTNLANLDTMTPTIAEGGDKVTIPSDIGFRRTLPDWVKFAPGTTQVTVSESSIEYAQGTYTAPAGLEGYTVMVRRPGVAELVPLADVLADKTIKIAGGATSIDATFVHFSDDTGNPDATNTRGTLDYQELSGTNMQYDHNPTFVNYEGEGDAKVATKNTGIKMKAHPYIQGIADSWWTGTRELTLAVVGTMPSEQKTIFIHMGSSVGSGKGLMLATSEKADEVVVAWNNFKVINEITRMSVPNAASARHVYIVTKQDNVETQKTTFTVYLDGMKWKTLEVDLFTITGGVQVGSDFGGDIARNGEWKAANGDTGIVNAIRVYGRVISADEIAQYSVSSEYPYHSPNGSSTRTFTEGSANWVEETDVWSNTPAEGDASTGTAPLAGASVTATLEGEATIAVNVPAEGASYEALDIAGSGSAVFTSATDSGAIRVTGMVTLGRPITVEPGSLDLGTAPITLLEDGTLTFDYSNFDVSTISTTTKINLTGDIAQKDDKVSFTQPTVQPYHTLAMAYDSGIKQYVLTITPNHEDGADVYLNNAAYFDGSLDGKVDTTLDGTTKTAVFPNDTVVFAEGKALPQWVGKPQCSKIKIATDVTLGMGQTSDADHTAVAPALDGVTITVEANKMLTLNNQDRSWAFGSVTMNGPGVVLVKGSVTATAIAGDATLKLSEGATLTIDTALSAGRVVSSVADKVVKMTATASTTIYALESVEQAVEEIPPADESGLVISIADAKIYKDGSETATGSTTIPNETGRYTVKQGDVTVAEIGVVAVAANATADAGSTKATTLVAVPFMGLDGKSVTADKLVNTALLAAGDSLKIYQNGTYYLWTLSAGKQWTSGTTVSAARTAEAPVAAETSVARGAAVWVTTANRIVVYGKYTTDAAPAATEGLNLMGNTTLSALEPAAKTGDQVEIPGDTSGVRTFTKTADGWTGVKTVTETVTLGGQEVSVKHNETSTEAPRVPAGRGYFLKRPAAQQQGKE